MTNIPELQHIGDSLYFYKASCRRVVDGDTFDLDIDLGLGTHQYKRVRLYGVNTPETYGVKKVSEEYKAGMRAKNRVVELLLPDSPIKPQLWIKTYKDRTGKYGRYLADIFLMVPTALPEDPELKHEVLTNMSSLLVEEGLAEIVSY